jgi:hypothetical protein
VFNLDRGAGLGSVIAARGDAFEMTLRLKPSCVLAAALLIGQCGLVDNDPRLRVTDRT